MYAVIEQTSTWISVVYTCTCVVNYCEALSAMNCKTAALCAVRYADNVLVEPVRWNTLCRQ